MREDSAANPLLPPASRLPPPLPLIEVAGLAKHYPVRRGILIRRRVGTVRAVDDVSFTIHEGETLGLIGESGAGKSSVGRLILNLLTASAGAVRYKGVDLLKLSAAQMRPYRQDLQIIFQDPFSSLNPKLTIGSAIAYPMKLFGLADRQERQERVGQLLERVGLSRHHANRYPHEFSGGQRQRIGIARALAVRPRFIVLDEPVSALDVSIQAQVLNLLRDLQEEYSLTFLFIANNLNVVQYLSDRVAVMYMGRIVELATSEELYRQPLHPHTQALLSSVLTIRREDAEQPVALGGEITTPLNLPSGCRFRRTCPRAQAICAEQEPLLTAPHADGHLVACHFPG